MGQWPSVLDPISMYCEFLKRLQKNEALDQLIHKESLKSSVLYAAKI